MSLLTACNRAQRALSLAVTSAIVGDTQETTQLLYELAMQEVEETAQAKDWPILRRTQSFTASLASLQSAPGKPGDFDRAIPDTFWNVSTDRRMYGPINDQQWAEYNGWPVTSQITQYVMFRYDGLHIFPAPTVADTITFDYIINTPWESSGGTAKTAPTLDTDVSKLGDRLLRLGVIWRYKQTKGRDYAEDMRSHQFAIEEEYSKQIGAGQAVSASGSEVDGLLGVNVPETGFGTPI